MTILGEVNERSDGHEVPVSFFDKAGQPATPAEGDYRIDDEASGQQVRDWTPLSTPLGETVAIPLAPADVSILKASEARETRLITVRWKATPDSDYIYTEYRVQVRNLLAVT